MVKKANKQTAEVTEVIEGVLAEDVVVEEGVVLEAAPEVTVDAEEEQEVLEEIPDEEVAAVVEAAPVDVSHNASLLVWPTDVWGFTAPLKDAIISAASRINGAADKKAIVDAVLATGLAHIEAKFAVDAKIRQAAIDAVIAENETKEALEETIAAQGELF